MFSHSFPHLHLLMFPSGRLRSIIYGKNVIPLPSVKKATALQGTVIVTKVAVLFTGLAVWTPPPSICLIRVLGPLGTRNSSCTLYGENQTPSITQAPNCSRCLLSQLCTCNNKLTALIDIEKSQ